MLNTVALGRLQFAATTIYHFLFVPLTIGLSFLVAYLHTRYYRTNDVKYKRLTKYFGGLFLINFGMGVVTGIVQEFQFGMNWSSYSRFVGDIFGAPLAIEALVAFFIESTFLGLWIFGWDKLPKRIHLASIWLVAVSSTISAFWIITANAFMQDPTGFVIRNGRAEMVDFFALITSPQAWLQFTHTVFSSFVTGGVFVMGISAYNLLKKNSIDMFKLTMKMGLIFAAISLIFTIVTGDAQGKYLVKHQPMKMSAAEGLWESADPAPFSIVSVINEKEKKNDFELSIPSMFSFMSYGKFTGKVTGINELQAQYEKQYGPGNYIPPVTVTFWSFRIMIGAGMLMLLIMFGVGFYYVRNKLSDKRWLLWITLLMLPLPYICNTTGWMMTEMGRQPWIVNGVLRVSDGVSKSITPQYVLTSLIAYILIYGLLIIVSLYLCVRFIKKGIEEHETNNIKDGEGDQLWT